MKFMVTKLLEMAIIKLPKLTITRLSEIQSHMNDEMTCILCH